MKTLNVRPGGIIRYVEEGDGCYRAVTKADHDLAAWLIAKNWEWELLDSEPGFFIDCLSPDDVLLLKLTWGGK